MHKPIWELFRWFRQWRICLQCRGLRFSPWAGKIPLEKGMATHSSILAWRIPLERGVWWATVAELNATEWGTHSLIKKVKWIFFIDAKLTSSSVRKEVSWDLQTESICMSINSNYLYYSQLSTNKLLIPQSCKSLKTSMNRSESDNLEGCVLIECIALN